MIYGSPYIEVEYGWGNRPWGWRLFRVKEIAIQTIKENSKSGGFDSGFFTILKDTTIGKVILTLYNMLKSTVSRLRVHVEKDSLEGSLTIRKETKWTIKNSNQELKYSLIPEGLR